MNPKRLFAAVACVFFLACTVQAETFTTTATGTTNAYSVIADKSGRKGLIYFASVTSDLAGSKFRAWAPTTTTGTANGTYSILTNKIQCPTNGFAVSDVIVIKAPLGVYERAVIGSLSSNIIQTTVNMSLIIPDTGDTVYKMSNISTVPVGAATITLNAQPIFAIGGDGPKMVDVTGTSACTINTITGDNR